MNRIPFAFLVAAVVGFGGQAQADPPSALTTLAIAVPYGDLDLATVAGAKAMLDRLDRAADTACGGRPDTGPFQIERTATWRSCREASLGAAVARADSPKLSQVYAASREPAVTALAKR